MQLKWLIGPSNNSEMITKRIEAARSIALLVLAVAVTLGEGVSLAALAIVALLALVDFRSLKLDETSPWCLAPAIGIALWASSGAVAWLIGGYGVLDFGEVGRWMSFGALALVPLSMARLERAHLERIATAYLVTLVVASLFALATVALNARPGEWLVRGASNGIHQGRMPFDASQTVAGGFYFHRLKFAHVSALGVLLLTVRQLAVPMSGVRRGVEGAALGVVTVAFFLTYVRASVLGVGAGLFVLALFAGSRSRKLLIAGAVLAGIAVAAVPTLSERIATIFAAQASGERALIWSQAIRVIADHPFGVGLGNYPTVAGLYYDLVDATFPTRTYAHSLWLTAWAETGPLGVVGFIGGFATLGWWARRYAPDPHALAAMAAIACFFTTGLAHDVFYDPPVALTYASVIAFLARRTGERHADGISSRHPQAQTEHDSDEGPDHNVGGMVTPQMNP